MDNRRRWASITTRTFRWPRGCARRGSGRPIVAIYRFARTADDIADEGDAAPGERLADLRRLPRRPPGRRRGARAVDALAATCSHRSPRPCDRHRLPVPLLDDLLDAFAQDVDQTRYADRAALLDYCRALGQPGRPAAAAPLRHRRRRRRWPGPTPSARALQLANFWQDLGVDAPRGRLYVPRADCRRHGVEPDDAARAARQPGVRALVARARRPGHGELMTPGAPLVRDARAAAPAGSSASSSRAACASLERIDRLGGATLADAADARLADAPVLAWRALRCGGHAGQRRRHGAAAPTDRAA